MKCIDDIRNYVPKNEQEETDQKAIVSFINHNSDFLVRSNLVGHMTSSAIVMNKKRDKVLFAYHKIYDSWAWVGGHNDGDDDCLHVAIKEAKEETGLENVSVLTEEIAGLDVIYVNNHIKHGKYVGDHLHFNVTYILIADENEKVMHKEDENLGVKWFKLDELDDNVSEERMKYIYHKLIDFAVSYKR